MRDDQVDRNLMLTLNEFEQRYAERSGVTVEWLHAHDRHGAPCDCEEPDCEGWQMKHVEPGDKMRFLSETEIDRHNHESGELVGFRGRLTLEELKRVRMVVQGDSLVRVPVLFCADCQTVFQSFTVPNLCLSCDFVWIQCGTCGRIQRVVPSWDKKRWKYLLRSLVSILKKDGDIVKAYERVKHFTELQFSPELYFV